MYTKSEVLQIAKTQLALDYSCQIYRFEEEKNTLVENKLIEGRRIYDNDGCFLKILCLGGKSIITASPSIMPWYEEKLINKNAELLFEYPKLREIDKKLGEFGHEIADVHQYYLPNPKAGDVEAKTIVKWYEGEEISQFENDDRFTEAFVFDKNHPHMIAVAAFHDDKIFGMAGASADSETMWQIGIDVLPENRGKGIEKQELLIINIMTL